MTTDEAAIPITGVPEADQLLVDNPLALLIGMLMDQQVPMGWAFRGPFTLQERLGGSLDAETIAAMGPDKIEAMFRDKPAMHRYPGSMGKRTHALCTYVVEHYGGDAGAIWRDAPSGQEMNACRWFPWSAFEELLIALGDPVSTWSSCSSSGRLTPAASS